MASSSFGFDSVIYRSPGNNKKPQSIVTRKFLRRVLEYAQPYRRTIAVALVALGVKAGLGLIPPLLYRAIIDTAIPHKDKHYLTELALGLIFVPIAVAGLGVFKSFYVSKVGSHLIHDLRMTTYRHLQRSSVRFFTASKTGEIMSRLSSDVRGARNAITETFVDVSTNLATVSLTLAVMLYIEWRLTLVGLSVLPLFFFPANVTANKLRVLIRSQFDLYATTSAIANQTLGISGVLLTKVFGKVDHNVALYGEKAGELRDLSVRVSLINAWFSGLIGLISAFGTVVVYFWGGNMAIDGNLTVGTLISLTAYLTSLYAPITKLVNSRVNISNSLVSFERVFEVLDCPLEIADGPNAIVLDSIDGAVSFDRVSFSYARANYTRVDGEYDYDYDYAYGDGDDDGAGAAGPGLGLDVDLEASDGDDQASIGLLEAGASGASGASGVRRARRTRTRTRRPKMTPLPVLKSVTRFWPRGMGMSGKLKEYRSDQVDKGNALENVSFDIQPGQLVALVGPSGAGKTTLTALLQRFYDVTSGSVRLDGHDIRDIALDSLANVVGTVTQESFMFNDTLRANLQFAHPTGSATEDELRAACRVAHILDFIDSLPDGLDTAVGERGYRLSGGEKQRLAIARIVLKNPRILILDESTASLDSISEKAVQAALDNVMANRTSLVVAHRLSTVVDADLILVMDKGHLVESGTHSDLLALDGLYAQLYHTQFASAMAGSDAAPATAPAAPAPAPAAAAPAPAAPSLI